MKKHLTLVLVWFLLLAMAAPLRATKTTKHPSDSIRKTVQVKSYTKKNGKTVRSYTRRAPH